MEEYINPLGIKLLFNAKTFFCFNGCWSYERTHSIEGNCLTEGQIIDTMDVLPCPFPPTISLPEVNSIILNSPYNFSQVIRIKEKINKGIVFCCDTKLSGKANKDMNINHLGELPFTSW